MGFLYLSSLLLLLSSYCLASSSKGCGSSLPGGLKPGGPSELLDLESQGNNRTYLVHLPKNYDINTPAPLILGYHGNGEDAYNQESISQMSEAQWDRGYLVVYPNGVGVRPTCFFFFRPNSHTIPIETLARRRLRDSECFGPPVHQ